MSTKYVVSGWEAKITAHECTKETASHVWLKGLYYGDARTHSKKKDGDVFATWAEAHAELTRRAEARLTSARLSLQYAQGFAGNVRGMKPPQGGAITPPTTEA
jgi:hypothetical protein